mgnify:CR=1 FL=1
MVARDVSKSTLTSYLSSSTEVKADRVIVYDAENPTAHGPWKLRAQASLSKAGLLAGISTDDVDFATWVDTHYGATEEVATAKMRPDVAQGRALSGEGVVMRL